MGNDLNDQYSGRAKAFNDDLGGVISGFATAAVYADGAAKDAALQRLLEVLKLDNVELDAKTTLIGQKQELETQISVPPVVLVDNQPLVVQSAELHMSMSVSAQDAEASQSEYGGSLTAEGKVGFGPFSLSAKLSAHVSVSSSRKRSSDYSSTTDATLTMTQGQTPEGLSKIVDALTETVQTALLINRQLIGLQAQKLSQDALGPAQPPAPSPGG